MACFLFYWLLFMYMLGVKKISIFTKKLVINIIEKFVLNFKRFNLIIIDLFCSQVVDLFKKQI